MIKNIIRVFSANFIQLLTGIIIGFIVPTILSIDAYSNLKTYTFYISYIGFTSMGLVDGIYIKYGGKKFSDININILKGEHNIMLFIQVILTIVFLIFSFLSKNILLSIFTITILPNAMQGFNKMLYQAIGEFKKYTKISYIYSVTYLVLNILLVIIFKNKNFIFYCLSVYFSNITAFIYSEYLFYKKTKEYHAIYQRTIFKLMKMGIYITIGNLSVNLFYGIDKWFIKLFFSSAEFSYYSFALSMLNLITILINSIAIIFYNKISQKENIKELQLIKRYLIILGSFASLGFFAFSFIVNTFIQKYIPSLNIIAISFASYPFMIIINVLYVNIYKARKNEKKYLYVVLLMTFISIIYNFVSLMTNHSIEGIAIATLCSFGTWYIYSQREFNYLKNTRIDNFYMFCILIGFLIITHILNWIVGFFAYLCLIFFLTFLCYKKYILQVLEIIFYKQK